MRRLAVLTSSLCFAVALFVAPAARACDCPGHAGAQTSDPGAGECPHMKDGKGKCTEDGKGCACGADCKCREGGACQCGNDCPCHQADKKADGAKPADAKPADAKPADSKKADAKKADVKPDAAKK